MKNNNHKKTKTHPGYLIVAVAIMAVALWQAFAPFVLRGDEISLVRKQLKQLTPGNVAAILENNEKKPTLVFLYATWCSTCAPLGQKLLTMAENKELEQVQTLFLSLDEKEKDLELARYFVTHEYQSQFKPYILQQGTTNSLQQVLRVAGSHYEGGLPYIGLYDRNGKMRDENLGDLDEAALAKLLGLLRQSPAPNR